MDTMNIALPKPMKDFVHVQVTEGGYSSASEYVRDLIRADQKRKAEARLEALLLEGLEGQGVEATEEWWEAFRAKQQEQIMEDERRYLTPERQNDLVFRMQLAEAVRDLPGWTVMVDPEERYGFYPKATTILIAILTMTSTPIPTIHVHFENSRR